jgi:hypothetical protein
MKRIMNTAMLVIAALVFSLLAERDAAAVPRAITLNLVQADSAVTLGGAFGGIPFSPQDVDVPPAASVPPAGTTDYDPTSPSNRTTFQGTISVRVDDVNAPTSIQIIDTGSRPTAADADLSGKWLPEVQPFLDRDSDLSFGEFGDDSCPASGAQPADCTPGDATPAPAADADWGVRNVHPAFGIDLAYASVRDLVYNVTMPASVPVVAGQFASATENFEFHTGWLDYWVAAAAGNLRGRAELAGGDDDNQSALPSSYVVTNLGGNQREIKLTIPLSITDVGSDATFSYTGQLVGTLIVPEPGTFVLAGIAMAFASAFAARRRK